MPDREKVLKAMECIAGRSNGSVVEAQCRECPYNAPILESGCDEWAMIEDALALLKTQEAVEPKLYTPEDKTIWSSWHICGACEHPVDPGDRFCRKCGRAIKWEEQDD